MTAKNEALGEPTLIPFRGREYALPAVDDWPTAAFVAFEEGKVALTIRALFPEQWDEILAAAPRVRDLMEFTDAIAEALNAPNS